MLDFHNMLIILIYLLCDFLDKIHTLNLLSFLLFQKQTNYLNYVKNTIQKNTILILIFLINNLKVNDTYSFPV
ncbi:hypothetical protein SAMN04488018_12233 [Myroides marinus]|uniref:Uncharacterized protein n=1 Tax=Myroides marinus TaxID=703342 RepID=A0A1H6XX50_9FLAO|nr:hypothetical protein SAMN04488018_12233 [Myroides marinus]